MARYDTHRCGPTAVYVEQSLRALGTGGQAASGTRRFTDETVPAGVERVEYTVQGQRGRRTGQLSEILMVTIGLAEAGTRGDSRTSVVAVNASAPRHGIASHRAMGAALARTH